MYANLKTIHQLFEIHPLSFAISNYVVHLWQSLCNKTFTERKKYDPDLDNCTLQNTMTSTIRKCNTYYLF